MTGKELAAEAHRLFGYGWFTSGDWRAAHGEPFPTSNAPLLTALGRGWIVQRWMKPMDTRRSGNSRREYRVSPDAGRARS